MSEASPPRGQSPQSVTRVIRILEVLCARTAPASLAELGRELQAPKSSLAALLRGLSDEGFVVASEGGWKLGPGAFGLGSALLEARRRFPAFELVRDGMRRLAEKTGETVLFGVRDPGGETMTYVDSVESRNAVRFAVSVGDRRALYCTAGGRMLLAMLREEETERYFASVKPAKLTSSTETNRKALSAAVAAARSAGVAQTVDQAADGVTGTAAPIHGASGDILGVLIVAAPSGRWHERGPELSEMVRAEAALTSRSLGHRSIHA